MSSAARDAMRVVSACAGNLRGGDGAGSFGEWARALKDRPGGNSAPKASVRLQTAEDAEALGAARHTRIAGELWKRAADLRASKVLEKESLRKQLKECSSRVQEIIEKQVDDYLGAHEETLSRLGQQRHAALEKSASLDSILQRRRREHEQEFSSKKQKMEGEVKEAQPDGRAEEVKMQIAAGKERTDALARSREEGCAELAQVEEEIALLHAKMRDARQCDDEDGKSVLTLEAQMRRIEASRESQLLALQDTLKALTGKRGLDGALRKREQLFNNLISFLKQRASNPTEMQAMSWLLARRFQQAVPEDFGGAPRECSRVAALILARTGLEVEAHAL